VALQPQKEQTPDHVDGLQDKAFFVVLLRRRRSLPKVRERLFGSKDGWPSQVLAQNAAKRFLDDFHAVQSARFSVQRKLYEDSIC